jgi:hypothetical protein
LRRRRRHWYSAFSAPKKNKRHIVIKEARLSPGPGFNPLHAALYYGMRLVPNYTIRRCTAWTLANTVCASKAASSPAESAQPLETLRRNGIATIAPVFSAAQLDEVSAYLRDKPVEAPDGREYRLAEIPAGTRLASYPLGTILECPHLLEALNREDILAMAEAYLGARPLISATRVDCAFPTGGAPCDVQRFHRDYDDWRFFKLFVYLTDTDLEEGPHEFVRTSHLYSGRLRANEFSPDYIAGRYGPDAVVRQCGPRGTSFVADTWGIHRGSPPKKNVRMLFQATYSLLRTYKFEYHPVRTPRAGQFDRRINRLLMA